MTDESDQPRRGRLSLRQYLSIHLIIGLLASAVCLWLFSQLAEDVATHDAIVHFDQLLADALHQLATPVTTTGFLVISLLGNQVVLVLAISLTVLYLLHRHWMHATFWLIALAGGQVLNWLLKDLFARPRPVFQNPLVTEVNYSFPSGHAMMSLITYGLLAYFAVLGLRNRGSRALVIASAAFLVLMIGLSRIYLGVHYFSDVVGGYAAAGVWLSACITAMDWIRRHRPKFFYRQTHTEPPLASAIN